MARDTETPNGDICIFTSLRYDPTLLASIENSRPELSFLSPSPFYMLVYHRDRLMEAAQHFDFDQVVEKLADGRAVHETLLQEVKKHNEESGKDEPLKVRVQFDKSANMTVDLAAVSPVALETLYPPSLDPPRTGSGSNAARVHSKPFTPSPLTGGALSLGPTDSLPETQVRSEDTPVPWLLRLDKAPTPSSPFTVLKTTMRDLYNTSRARALPSNPQNPKFVEVMLYNECNELTEGSIT
jgi:branched-subunit amino acid aminotransferase/4-amino-4-deoxychorismate lyase